MLDKMKDLILLSILMLIDNNNSINCKNNDRISIQNWIIEIYI